MQPLRFYKVSPGGNITILVLDPVAAKDRARVALHLMADGHLGAEQVGFLDLEAAPVRLDMMGGEFCGNACRAAAAVMAHEGRGLTALNADLCGELSVSGAEDALKVEVRQMNDGYNCQVEMPMAGTRICTLEPGLTLVRLPGISHLCLDERRHAFADDYAAVAAQLRRTYGLEADDASGCIWYSDSSVGVTIRPVVWVRQTDTTYYETGCGSGSLAVAMCHGGQKFPIRLKIRQPSGADVGVCLEQEADSCKAWIYGSVALIARGEAFV